MATNNEREFLGREGTEQLVAEVKALVGDVSKSVDELGAVSYKAQSLTEAQKVQVKLNLGIEDLRQIEVTDDGQGNVSVILRENADSTGFSTTGLTLTDRTTGINYVLYVDNGKLMMTEVS